jgi:ABC-type phosphate transport system substrate-binding protein
MVNTRMAVRLGLAVAAAGSCALALGGPAGADAAPSTTDVVGVGSDIVQNSLDFLADGDPEGSPGYNTAGNKNRLFSFDATADANGRNAFTDPALGSSALLNPTVVLRAGTSPVQRPNGGGAGLTALVNDGKNGVSANRISFVRSPNLPTDTQQNAAQANLGSPLHSVQIATDQQVIATAETTHAPAALSAQDLVGIYQGTIKHWNEIPGNSGGSTDAIIPLIPQNGAGVRTVFLNALKAANGGNAITLGGTVLPVQQNDPTTITGLSASDAANAIVPFPVGRYELIKSGYFLNPNQPYSAVSPPSALGVTGLKLIKTGTSPSGGAAFSTTIPYYIVFRESDIDGPAWQPGSTLSWVRELFYNPGGGVPFVASGPGQALLTEIGVTPAYLDRGNDTSGP